MSEVLEQTWRFTAIAETCLREFLGAELVLHGFETGKVIGGIGMWNEIGATGVVLVAYPEHRRENAPACRGVFVRVDLQEIGDFGVNYQDNDALNLRPVDRTEKKLYQKHGISWFDSPFVGPDNGVQLKSAAAIASIQIGTVEGQIEPLDQGDPVVSISYDWAVRFGFSDGAILSLSTNLTGIGSLDGEVALRPRDLTAADYSHLEGFTTTWRELSNGVSKTDERSARHN